MQNSTPYANTLELYTVNFSLYIASEFLSKNSDLQSETEGVKTERRGWAYHYTDISCNVSVQGVLYLKQPLIELAVEYNSDISINVTCSGLFLQIITGLRLYSYSYRCQKC